MNGEMPQVSAPGFVAITDRFNFANNVEMVYREYQNTADAIVIQYKLESEHNWKDFRNALEELARRLWSGDLATFNDAVGNFNLNDEKSEQIRATYCHLLAARLLRARLCPKK